MIINTPAELYLPDARIVALVGAGGKTSLMIAMAAHAVAAGETVVLTTTTKLAANTAYPVFWDGQESSLPCLQSRLFRSRSLILARDRAPTTGKLLGLTPEAVDLLAASGLTDRVFVEADGARGKSLKAPADHEPVIPRSTDLVIGIMGAEAFGAPMNETHVFRPERLSALSDVRPSGALDAYILARLVAHPQGLFKNAPPSPCRRVLYVNKMDRVGESGWEMLRHARRLSEAAHPDGPTSATLWFAGSIKEVWLLPVDGD